MKQEFPFDIVTHILDYTDVQTYNSCSILSREYRANWANHPRVGCFKLFKARTTPKDDTGSASSPLEHCVSALSIADMDSTSLHPRTLYLFHTDDGCFVDALPMAPGVPIFIQHLERRDPWRRYSKFVLLTSERTQETTCYIVQEGGKDQCNEELKQAFRHPFDSIAYRGCAASGSPCYR